MSVSSTLTDNTNGVAPYSRELEEGKTVNEILAAATAAVEDKELADLEIDVEEMRYRCLRILRLVFVLLLPLTIVSTVFATMYGWIYVRSTNYKPDKSYEATFTPSHWQSCIAYSPSPNNKPQTFPITMAAAGGQMFIFLGLALKATYLALHDLELLPYSLCVSCFTLIGMIVYRPVNPIIPSVTEMPPTLLTITTYIRSSMYEHVGGSKAALYTNCSYAVGFNRAAMALLYVTLVCNLISFCIQIFALWRSWRLPRESPYVFRMHQPALILVALAFIGYVITAAAKENSVQVTLTEFRRQSLAFEFPFVRPTLDVIGLFLLLTVSSVVYGSCKQETEPFKWAAFTAYVHVLLSFPIILDNLKAYSMYRLWNPQDCSDFLVDSRISQAATRAIILSKAEQSTRDSICRDLKITLAGQFGQFSIMVVAMFVCLFVVLANWRIERPSVQLFGGESMRESLLLEDPPPCQRRSRFSSAFSGRKTPSSINDHLLGPVLD